MTDDGRPQSEPEAAELVRPYVITRGRALPAQDEFSLITLVTTATDERQRPRRLSPRSSTSWRCAREATSPLPRSPGTPSFLSGSSRSCSVPSKRGYLLARVPVPRARLADVNLLQEVLDGLRTHSG